MTTSPPLSVGAAARQFGVTPKTLTSWLKAGKLAGFQLPSGRWRVTQAALDAALTVAATVAE